MKKLKKEYCFVSITNNSNILIVKFTHFHQAQIDHHHYHDLPKYK